MITEFLKFYPKSILLYFNMLRTCKLRQYFIDATQVLTLALWCKTMHHSGGTIVWLATRIIDIYESSIDAIIFNEPSCPPKLLTIHPKILTEICLQVGLMVIPIKLGSESLPLCFLDLRHNNNPRPHKTKKRNIKPSSLDR